jgi:hypothetical protein
VSHGKADLRQIATDAFGNALGDSLARLSTAPNTSEETLKATQEARELVKRENPEGMDLFEKLLAAGLNVNQILRYTTDKEFTTPLSRLNRVINQAEQAKASGQSSQEILTQNVQSDSEISNQNGNVIHVDQENTISVPVKTSVGVAVLQDIGKINGRLTEIKEKYGIDEVMTVAAIAVMGPLGFARALAKDVVTDYVIGDAIGAVNMKAAMVLTAFVHGSSEATVNQVLNFDELHPPGSDAKERKEALDIKEDASKTMAGAIIVTGAASSLLLGLATNAWSPSKGSSVITRNQVGAVGFDVKKPKTSAGNQTYANTQTINGANTAAHTVPYADLSPNVNWAHVFEGKLEVIVGEELTRSAFTKKHHMQLLMRE